VRAAVLAYHSHNIAGTDYATNDHVALARDLEALHAIGARIVPLSRIADALREGRIDDDPKTLWVGLSFDDGPVFDWEDFEHPRFGLQRGFSRILAEFRERHGAAAQPELHATSFVIASPAARAAMERAEDCGYTYLTDWLTDRWWAAACDSGMHAIGNHSWDHVHHAPDSIAADLPRRDDFSLVRTVADAEIRRASDFINERVSGRCTLFAYPFGHVNDFLRDDYLPTHRADHGMEAAFGVDGRRVTADDSVWNIPRAVCGYHWHDTNELAKLLA
jgi:peptidoglycan/xylan/chitin deacetylase (PgdA/CDA1 family)